MPYDTNADLPDAVRNSLPQAAQTRFRQTVNSRLSAGQSDERAFRQAWYVVHQGWKKPKGEGRWVRKFESPELLREKLTSLKERYRLLSAEYDVVEVMLHSAEASWVQRNDKTTLAQMKELKGKCKVLSARMAETKDAIVSVQELLTVLTKAAVEYPSYEEAEKYRPDQARDAAGRWTEEGGGGDSDGVDAHVATKPGAAGKKPSKGTLQRQIKQSFMRLKQKRSDLNRRLRLLNQRLGRMKHGTRQWKDAQATLKDLKRQRAEMTRGLKRLADKYLRAQGRNRGGVDWIWSTLAGLPISRDDTRRRLSRKAAGDEIDKGYPEYDENQPRDESGRWTAGGGRGRRGGKKPSGGRKPPAKKPPAKKPPAKKPPAARKPPAKKPPAPAPKPPVQEAPPAPKPPATPAVPDRLRERDEARLNNLYDQYDAHTNRMDELVKGINEINARLNRLDEQSVGARSGSWREFNIQRDYEELTVRRNNLRRELTDVRGIRESTRLTIEALEARLRGKKRASTRVIKYTGSLFARRKLLNAKEVVKWAKAQGFETTLDPSDMHVTLAYSKDSFRWPKTKADRVVIPASKARAIENLGEQGAIGLRFNSDTLADRWSDLLSKGASWDHGDRFKPHVTITWQKPEDLDLSKVKPYTGRLVFGPERFSEIDPDWNPPVEKMREIRSGIAKATRFSGVYPAFTKRATVDTVQLHQGPYYHCDVIKVKADEGLGIIFGWAIVSSENGEPYYDTQGDHIPEDAMLKAAADFMQSRRTLKIMHAGRKIGTVLFAWPMTQDISKAMGVEGVRTGLMIGVKPDKRAVLERFASGKFTGFSIGGNRIIDEAVDD